MSVQTLPITAPFCSSKYLFLMILPFLSLGKSNNPFLSNSFIVSMEYRQPFVGYEYPLYSYIRLGLGFGLVILSALNLLAPGGIVCVSRSSFVIFLMVPSG